MQRKMPSPAILKLYAAVDRRALARMLGGNYHKSSEFPGTHFFMFPPQTFTSLDEVFEFITEAGMERPEHPNQKYVSTLNQVYVKS